eukprot:Rmarinus@m.29654
MSHRLEALRQLAAQKQAQGDDILKKINKLESKSKKHRKQSVVGRHRHEWYLEAQSLLDTRNLLEKDLRVFIQSHADTRSNLLAKEMVQVMKDEANLAKERRKQANMHFFQIQQLQVTRCGVGLENYSAEEKKLFLQESLSYVRASLSTWKSELDEQFEKVTKDLEDIGSMSILDEGRSGDAQPHSRPTSPESVLTTATMRTKCASVGGVHSGPALRIPKTDMVLDLDKLPVFDERVLASYTEKLQVVDSQLHEAMERLREEYQSNCTPEQSASPATGGWTEERHAKFLKILGHYGTTGKSRQMLSERLALELPDVPKFELLEHERWLDRVRTYNARRRASVQKWMNDRADLVAECHKKICDSVAAVSEQASKVVETMIFEENRARVAEELEAMRERKMAHLLEEENKIIAAKETLEKKLLIEKEKERRVREEQRAQLQAYHKKLAAIADERKLAEEEYARKQQEAKKVRMKSNIPRVKFRQEEYERHRDELAQKQKERERSETDKERRLQAIRALVRIDAEVDPGRVLQNTAASNARVTQKEEAGKAFRDVQGYQMDTLMKDERFKLSLALSDAGLLKSEYAGFILSRAHTNQPMRPDMKNSFNIGR